MSDTNVGYGMVPHKRNCRCDECEIERLRAERDALERDAGTLLGMIRHQRDVLTECLPYLHESMAGRRPGRSADDIRAAVKALTTDAAVTAACFYLRATSAEEPKA